MAFRSKTDKALARPAAKTSSGDSEDTVGVTGHRHRSRSVLGTFSRVETTWCFLQRGPLKCRIADRVGDLDHIGRAPDRAGLGGQPDWQPDRILDPADLNYPSAKQIDEREVIRQLDELHELLSSRLQAGVAGRERGL